MYKFFSSIQFHSSKKDEEEEERKRGEDAMQSYKRRIKYAPKIQMHLILIMWLGCESFMYKLQKFNFD